MAEPVTVEHDSEDLTVAYLAGVERGRDASATELTALRKRVSDLEGAATTHARTLEALREAEKALEFYTNRMTYVSRIGMESPITRDNFGDIGRAALARIKETP